MNDSQTPQVTDQDTVTLEPRHLRSCLSRFVTGVAVVSYLDDGEPRGVTVNSFTSVSMDPPLVLVSIARSAKSCDQLDKVPFAINLLKANQFDVAMQFAGRPRPGASIRWEIPGPGLPPVLGGALASFQCQPWAAYDGGDHVLHIGQVIRASIGRDEEPLLFDRGRFAMVGLSLFDTPRIVDPEPVTRGGLTRSHFVHATAATC
jgi:flavin reductase (DIM6/NTAB) family NADH-FMN oxidoreductase RutF